MNMDIEVAKGMLRLALLEIEDNDPSSFTFKGNAERKDEHYKVRNDLIYDAVSFAKKSGFVAGFNVHTPIQDMIDKGWDHRWGVVAYIELPTGQISYHIESPDIVYDGHDYTDKHERIVKFAQEVM